MKYAEILANAEEAKTVQSLTVAFKKWEKKGETVLGRLMAISQVPSGNGEGTYSNYLFDTDGGYIKCALGKAADTDIGPMWSLNAVYHIKYEGREKLQGGKSLHRFVVDLVAPAPLVDGGVVRVDSVTGEVVGDDDVPF